VDAGELAKQGRVRQPVSLMSAFRILTSELLEFRAEGNASGRCAIFIGFQPNCLQY
jgi:hypothetical protein